MPAPIACPACRRALTLPPEALNRQVQCPVCQHRFHPAEATPVEHVRAALPNADRDSALPARRASAPLPTAEARRSEQRGKRETEDICPKCRAFVARGTNKCAECGAEFEPEDDGEYRPWEQDGMERRDSDPHRGGTLMLLGVASLVVPIGTFCPYFGLVMTLLGLGFGISAWVLGQKDLGKIDRHIMDRAGRGLTQGGMWCGAIGTILNALALLVAAGITISAM
jgi:LSD1 subclass zinc finger protein